MAMRFLTSVVFLLVFLAIGFKALSHERPAPEGGPHMDGVPRPSDAAPPTRTFLGFDRNEYPGDDALPVLRKSFAFTGYWLSVPPGAKTNSWQGKRALLQSQGFGF